LSDLGSIGTSRRTQILRDKGPRQSLHHMVIGDRTFWLGGKETSEGNSQPSLRLDARARFRFRWKVDSGSRSISVDVKQGANVSPRPTLVILANADIGVAETTGTAGSGTAWVTIGPVSIAPSSAGAVWVELRSNYDCGNGGAPCYWDNLSVS